MIKSFISVCDCVVLLTSCDSSQKKERSAPKARKVEGEWIAKPVVLSAPQWLSEYEFFEGNLANLNPAQQVYPYAINTPLFSDYAEKARFIYLPNKQTMTYTDQGPLDFPDGAILIKNFYYHIEQSASDKRRQILETRLLVKENGEWNPLNYIWNTAQTDARLDVVGKTELVKWTDDQGRSREVNYVIPNRNQCNNCHNANNTIVPIGTTVAQLNQPYLGNSQLNQLAFFSQEQILTGYDPTKDHDKLPVWDDPSTGNTHQRSRAYLDANCAHCHSAVGSAKNAGLYLQYSEEHPRNRGIFKPPIAAGKGSGNLNFDIVPGKPEESILIYRMRSNNPAIRMPEIGRSIPHEEGIALLTSYIEQLAME